MSTTQERSLCRGCGAEIAASFLDCPVCHRLVHGAELTRLAAEARQAEEQGDLTTALGTWRKTLELLPSGTTQRATIEGQMQKLGAMIDGRAPRPAKDGRQGGKAAGVIAGTGAAGAMLIKFKALLVPVLANAKFLLLGLFKLPTLLSMMVFAQVGGGGHLGFWIGLTAAIYVHEIGHVATLRRYGIEASAPMFVPGLGALVRMKQYPTDAHEEARTGLAGPLWGLFASAVALGLGVAIGSPTALFVASTSASINVFNLIPVWQLDGSRGLKALSTFERVIVGVAAIAVGVVTRQRMPAVVGVIVLGRLAFGKAHPTGDRRVLALFLALVVLHPACAWVADRLIGGA
jgi:Zn-dependent protease